MTSALVVFAACFLFWLLLSGHLDAFTVTLGLLASALVAWANRHDRATSTALAALPRLALYAPWLLKEIVLANLDVARLVLHPRLPIEPTVVRLAAPLTTDLAVSTLGNSITLTPGTVTLDIEGRELVVHAVTGRAAAALLEGSMLRRVARVFGDRAP